MSTITVQVALRTGGSASVDSTRVDGDAMRLSIPVCRGRRRAACRLTPYHQIPNVPSGNGPATTPPPCSALPLAVQDFLLRQDPRRIGIRGAGALRSDGLLNVLLHQIPNALFILLLEAGPDPNPIPELVANATLQARLLLEAPYVEMYPTPRAVDGSTFYSLAGRIMGGGSSVNVMSALRPMRADMQAWVAAGNAGWDYDTVLPVLKRIESDQDYPDSPLHGCDGPLYLKRNWTLGTMDPCSSLARPRTGHVSCKPRTRATTTGSARA